MKKTFNVLYNVGKAKYLVSYHDGVKKHKDGSAFFDIKVIRNKKELKHFTDSLLKEGYNQPDQVFPNGFTSWQEKHYEVAAAITTAWNSLWEEGDNAVKQLPENRITTIQAQQGHGGLYELAEELTNKFEKKNEGRQWDGEFFDEIEEFLKEELK